MMVILWGELDCEDCISCSTSFDLLNIPYIFSDINSVLSNSGELTDLEVGLLVFLNYNEDRYPIVQIDDAYYTCETALEMLRD